MKTCTKCGFPKELSEFSKRSEDKGTLQSWCRCCQSEYNALYRENNSDKTLIRSRKYYENNREKEISRTSTNQKRRPIRSRRNAQLRYKYGIDVLQYDELFNKQNGCCYICGTPQYELKKRLSVDHNHLTEEVRGLLCTRCNQLLGHALDSIDLLSKAITYLQKF
jgi:hypothetical protein